jgi:hypothetical protein
MASCPGKPVPDFGCSNEEALADIRMRAKEDGDENAG